MQLDDFANMTLQIIQRNGLDDYLPTACFPVQKKLLVLEEIPAGMETEVAARSWARSIAQPGESYFLAYRHSDTEFKVVHIAGEQVIERIMTLL
jgi:hypothetical protein